MFPNLPNLSLKGPFWSADAEVIQLADPQQNWAFRALFVDINPKNALGTQNLLLPGTLLVLCWVKQVRVTTANTLQASYLWQRKAGETSPKNPTLPQIETLLKSGQLALLLVEADPDPTKWRRQNQDAFPELVCLAGDINLDVLTPAQDVDRLYAALRLRKADNLSTREESARLLGAISVHGSGLSIAGKVRLPWETEPITAVFQLARTLPDPSGGNFKFRLTIEADRLTPDETNSLIDRWNRLSSYLNPRNPRNRNVQAVPVPNWVTLEVANPLRLPRLYWEIANWQEPAPPDRDKPLPILFERGEINLLLSDRQPYDAQQPPTSVAQIVPDKLSIQREGDRLTVALEVGKSSASTETLKYEARLNQTIWDESLELNQLQLAFSPVQTAQLLRDVHKQSIPEWVVPEGTEKPNPIEPSLLWGFMPLEDGWAQLPIPNLTEQIYLDADLALDGERSPDPGIFAQGVVSLGNSREDQLKAYRYEQPWSVTWTDASYLTGTWQLQRTGDTFQLQSIDLNAVAPEVVLNGFFWLSTQAPTAADALPSVENWISSLQSVPLKSIEPQADLFPPLMTTHFEKLEIKSRSTAPQLQDWSMIYDANAALLNQMVTKGVLPADTFSQYPPLVWRRHKSLPMVQALPLTQSQSPPNYPSPNRQLVPFQLAITKDGTNPAIGLPSNWKFAVTLDNGAASWCTVSAETVVAPAADWQTLADLPLVALSLPGVVLDPNLEGEGLPTDDGTQLPLQYRFDLPYSDEINALAQLPKIPRDPKQVSPLPDEPVPQPPQPLTRETLATHWQKLSEQASLASADATDAIVPQGDQSLLRHLVEPFDWQVKLTKNLDAYPGSLDLANADNSAALSLTGEAALKGISGDFAVTQNRIARLPDGTSSDNPFHLEAGSMAAHRAADGTFRDQRGLLRSATHPAAANPTLLKTPVRLQEDSTGYELTSLLTAVPLTLTPDSSWQFWFRDLPVKSSTFDRAKVRSQVAQDVNDPDALSRDYNYLEGYEWRLVGNSLFSLDFFPLTLEKVVFANDRIDEVTIVGRLQLPLPGRKELEQFNNAVQVTFKRNASGQLQFAQIQRVSPIGEWFLALEGNESSESPLLQWLTVEPTPAKDGIVIRDLELTFTLFEANWTIALSPLTFRQADTVLQQTYTFSNPNPSALLPDRATLNLDLRSGNHTLNFFLQVRLGDLSLPRSTFTARIHFPLLPSTSSISAESVTLFGGLKLTRSDLQPIVLFNRNALEFQWQGYELDTAQTVPLQLLPGMPLRANQAPGYVALTFAIEPGTAKIPALKLQTGFTEAMLSCQWSKFLQTATPTSQLIREQVFDSSAGDLAIGYTDRYDAPTSKWKQSLLLNGFLEVKSLISWALDTAIDATASQMTLPAARTANPPALNHLRHTARILFNQTGLTADRLIPGQNQLLFALKQPWQFLAVVEHQLTRILPTADLTRIQLGSDDRWTAVQEVRLFSPNQFKQALNNFAAAQILDPTGSITDVNRSSFGYWNRQFRQALADNGGELDRLPADTLLVDASAPHWIRKTPVKAASATTLQFLPNGTQLGILSNPNDYTASDPQAPDWLLLTTPFFGRLQNPQIDRQALTNPNSTLTALQVDPILAIQRQRTAQPGQPLADLPLMLANWSDAQPVTVRISGFDSAIGRSWARLNALSLEESWFRLQHPKSERQPDGVQSILASLPDTPARLSRATALNQAFTVLRSNYPPQENSTSVPDSTDLDNPLLVWRPDSLMTITGVAASEGLQALYVFQKEGDGKIVRDVSGVGVPLDLTIADPTKVEWLNGGGLRIKQSTLIKADQPALKIIQSCRNTNELTIEAWIQLQPNQSVQQGPARIVTLSSDTNNRYFTLGHGKNDAKPGNVFVVRLRIDNVTSSNGILNNGSPPIETNPGSVKAGLTHIVFTRRADGVMKFYIDGQEQASNTVPNKLFPVYPNENTDQTFRFGLGNELTGDRPWLGDYRQVAIFNRALPAAEVKQRFDRGVGSASQGQQRLAYPWSIVGLQVFTSRLLQTNRTIRVAHHAAATELPARLRVGNQPNLLPLSLAVSPYLGLEFRPAPDLQQAKLRLLTAELLCLDRTTGTLLPAASHVWAIGETQTPANYYSTSQTWARETHRRLCPDSSIAILRFRELREIQTTDSQATSPLLTTYTFVLVTGLEQPLRLVKRVVQLRSTVTQLRFREGQLGAFTIPTNIQPFELAPPQVRGVQPIHLTQRPTAVTPQTWDWGLSALRLSVQYGEQSAIGKLKGAPNGSATTQAITLWWQAPQHQVQFRSSQDDRATAGLPAHFRASAIKSLLPVLPNLPLPDIASGTLDQPPLSLNGKTLMPNSWQPVLPASLRYLLLGARSGAMFAIRNQLLRQSGLNPGKTSSGKALVSGSIPVQHRIPRPIPLPPNQQPETALQTWASYFEPRLNHVCTKAPADEAFFAASGSIPARRLRMTIENLVRGEIPTNWNGTLAFTIDSKTEPDSPIEWQTDVSLELNGTTFAYVQSQSTNSLRSFNPQEETLQQLNKQLSSLTSGAIVTAKVQVRPASGGDRFFQTLTFLLRVVGKVSLPLPLEPHFILFEDPEYNRRLASSTANASRIAQIPNGSKRVARTVTLACDRREYNSNSHIFLRFDWGDNQQTSDRKATLQLFRLTEGIAKPLTLNSGDEKLNPGELRSLSLKEIQTNTVEDVQTNSKVQLQPGDILEFKLIPEHDPNSPVFLQVAIVANSVIPVPQAAYALLRQQTQTGTARVECVRFAWSPAASRIELVSSEDLKTQVVRRRAVFKWQDSMRSEMNGKYAVQKIAQTGSTHSPTFETSKVF